MGKVWVKELTGGLDTRRLPETSPGGVLIKGLNGHINSGGEFEKRAAFVLTYSLPPGTVGLAGATISEVDVGELPTVFGSGADPGVPNETVDGRVVPMYYQRLEKDTKALVAVLSWDRFADSIYSVALFDDATIVHFYDDNEVTDWFDGRARASFRVTAGTAVGSAQLEAITVNGVSILGSPVPFDTDLVTTAAAIAAEINSNTSSPEYEATSVDDRVNIVASTPGSDANGRSVFFTLSGDLEVTPQTDLALAGGADSFLFQPGTFVKTVGRQMHALSAATWYRSGIDDPTHWTTEYPGASFFNQAKEASRPGLARAIADYQGFVAIICDYAILIWFTDPDPDLISKRQVLKNTGTVSPRSVTEYGDADVFYGALSGLRSMRARDSSSNATTTDLGSPIDSLIKAKFAAMQAVERQLHVFGLINPVDDRFWLIFPDGEIFVFSYFPNAKISAWTTYETGFTIDEATVMRNRVYLRSGDEIYTYGGIDDESDLVYDDTVAKAHLPAFDGNAPTMTKKWTGFDAAVEGTWKVFMASQVTDLTIRELVATIDETTFNKPRHPYEADATHVSPQFETTGDGPAKLSSVVLHNDMAEDG